MKEITPPMTLRDWFAGMALQALINRSTLYEQKAEEEKIADGNDSHAWQKLHSGKGWVALSDDADNCAFAAYHIADAMLEISKEYKQ
jgi:hypothetical protein